MVAKQFTSNPEYNGIKGGEVNNYHRILILYTSDNKEEDITQSKSHRMSCFL